MTWKRDWTFYAFLGSGGAVWLALVAGLLIAVSALR